MIIVSLPKPRFVLSNPCYPLFTVQHLLYLSLPTITTFMLCLATTLYYSSITLC